MLINPDPIIVGISGGSGCGKTYILTKLIHEYPETDICLLSQDHYYKPLSTHAVDENGSVNWDLPEGINEEELFADINQLIAGKQVEKWEYTFNHPELEPSLMLFKPAPILVVEGLFVFHLERIAGLLNLRVFIEANEALRLERRIVRDMAERSLSREQILYQWNHHVKPAYDHYLAPYITSADVTILNETGEPSLTELHETITAIRSSKNYLAEK